VKLLWFGAGEPRVTGYESPPMIRLLMSAAAAAMLIAAPVAASAATSTKPAAHAASKPAKRMAAKPRQASRDSGNAAVEQLNEQSLQRARGGQ
jgi:hypothetical protein